MNQYAVENNAISTEMHINHETTLSLSKHIFCCMINSKFTHEEIT